MNTSSHVLMGKFLYRYVEEHDGIRLDRRSFLLGNILPDYCPSFLIRPHFLKNHAAHVQKMIRFLLSQPVPAFDDKKYSRLLGVLCHFYADFFCCAHRESFAGGLPEHIAYETKLHRYFTENLEQLESIRFITQFRSAEQAGGLYRQFEALHSSYLLSHSSFGNDLLFAMTACIDLIVLTCGSAAKRRTGARRFGGMEAI